MAETIICPYCGYAMDSFDAREKAAKMGTDVDVKFYTDRIKRQRRRCR